MIRTIDEKKTTKRVAQAIAETDNGSGALTAEVALGRFETWLRKQPRAPHLISRQAAAVILGVASPGIARFQRQGKMPEAIEVDGSSPVYVKAEVVAFAKKREREKVAREKAATKRREKEK